METISNQINYNKSIQIAPCLKRYVAERLYPKRFLNGGKLTKLSKCIGLIGHRGSGKSLSASALAIIDYLIPGYNVISNMKIKWGVRLGSYLAGYASQDLDKMAFLNFDIESNCAVVIDEVNIEFSEARRSITNRNLIFNKILQQLRKRRLNVIYTVQHEMWIDNRLRYQTDVFIRCEDVCLAPGGYYLPYDYGEQIKWKIYDMSGICNHGAYGDTGRVLFDGIKFNGKRFWNTFDTLDIQGEDETTYGKMKNQALPPADITEPAEITKDKADWGWLRERIQDVYQELISARIYDITKAEMYLKLGIDSQTEIGQANKFMRQTTLFKDYGMGQSRWLVKELEPV